MQSIQHSRQSFLKKLTLGFSGIWLFSAANQVYGKQDDRPKLDPKQVNAFVGAAHSDLAKVKAMLEESPALINAAWDWGGGDFELGIGSASHVGHVELAKFLLEKGAPMNICTAAMLGDLAFVKGVIDRYPSQLHARGPHGFTLLHHAIKGGTEAEPVKEYLESLGAKETKIKI